MLIQMTRLGTVVAASDVEMREAGTEFARRGCLLLPQLLAPDLVETFLTRLEGADFYERRHGAIGAELCLTPGPLSGTLEFLANDGRFFDVVETIAGCPTIGCFQGRVYRLEPGGVHYDSWHSDVGEDRLVAMSINLTPDPYRGGTLQIRNAETGEMLHEIANTGLGDGVIFRIAPSLRHRVTPLEGTVARTAYAGWFRARPSYDELLATTLGSRVSTARLSPGGTSGAEGD